MVPPAAHTVAPANWPELDRFVSDTTVAAKVGMPACAQKRPNASATVR